LSDNRDNRLYEIDCDKPWSFNKKRFAKPFIKQEGRSACFLFFRWDRGQVTNGSFMVAGVISGHGGSFHFRSQGPFLAGKWEIILASVFSFSENHENDTIHIFIPLYDCYFPQCLIF
jgi:hypothetical protein